MFGQNNQFNPSNPPSNQPGTGLFGATNTAPAPLFGQPPGMSPQFGTTTQSGSSTMFGQTSSNQPKAGGFSFNPNTSPAAAFGAPSPFGSGTKAATQSNLFSAASTSASVGDSTSSNLFGKGNNTQNVFSSNVSSAGNFGAMTSSGTALFGTTPTTQINTGVFSSQQSSKSSSQATSPFGSQAFSATATPAQLFGKPATTRATTSTSQLFGKPATSEITTATRSRMFSTTSDLPGDTEKPPPYKPVEGLFGKGSGESSIQNNPFSGSANTGTGLFRKPPTNPSESTSGVRLFHHKPDQQGTESQASTSPSNPPSYPGIFGKPPQQPAPVKQPPQYPGLFGKPADSSSQQQNLFGKDSKSDAQASKESPEQLSERTSLPFSHGKQDSGEQPKTLFGKPVADDGTKAQAAMPSRGITLKRPKSPVPEGETSSEPTRRSSTEQLTGSRLALKCTRVPMEANNRIHLMKHFGKYGKVNKVLVSPAKKIAVVHFDSHADALNAKKFGRKLDDGSILALNWHAPSINKPVVTSASSSTSSSFPQRTLGTFQKTSVSSSSGIQRKTLDSEVDSELASMAGTSDLHDIRQLQHRRNVPTPPQGSAREGRSLSPAPHHSRSVSPHRKRDASPNRKDDNAGTMLLGELTGQSAHTAGDRYRLLDNRDKLIRQALNKDKKHRDIESAKSIQGTCPDMCPEKERYEREDKRRLNQYEMLASAEGSGPSFVVDHSLAVKEYSRSSADQAEPLPHELRPGPVLRMTMDYLMRNIMDTGRDGQWGDYYEFLWSRTRSIRKDITQQQLCDLIAVHLVETSARWHIYCGERLCEEDMMSFDEKINNENLTKCLQTLKELYSDLEKKGVDCPKEGEFRAYMVLMNLNEGDILRETGELRQSVRESDAVQFAIQVFYALNNNNYVRFFKLVKKANFLNACIMHRYFNQVRARALDTMLRAYSQKVKFPLTDLVRLLAFENEEDAAEFCIHHGLGVIESDVVFERGAFMRPETALAPKRAQRVIEAKQTTSVGEVVNGGPFPPSQPHQPSSSFDESGRLKEVALPVSARDKKEPQRTEVSSSVETSCSADVGGSTPDQTDGNQQIVVSNEVVKDIAKDLFLEVITEFCSNFSNGIVRAAKWYLDQAPQIASEFIRVNLEDLTKNVAVDVINECKEEEARERARVAMEKEQSKQAACQHIIDNIITDIVENMGTELAQGEYEHCQDVLKHQSMERTTDVIADSLLCDFWQSELNQVAKEVHKVDVVEKLARLDSTQKKVETGRMGRCFKKWRNSYAARIRLKGSMLNFPPGPALVTPQEQLHTLIPSSKGIRADHEDLHLSHDLHLTLKAPDKVIEDTARLHYRIAAHQLVDKFKHNQAFAPVDVVEIVKKNSRKNKNSSTNNYWKLLVSLPQTDSEAPEVKLINDWICAKFRKGTTPNPEVPNKTDVLSAFTSTSNGTVTSVCVRAVHGEVNRADVGLLQEKKCLQGVAAVLCVLSPLVIEQNLFSEERKRLESLVKALPLPCSLVVIATDKVNHLQVLLGLDLLKEENRIESYELMIINEDVMDLDNGKAINSAVSLLVERSNPYPQLESLPVYDYMENVLSKDYCSRVYSDLATRHKKGFLDQAPELLVELYNSLIQHTANQASSEELKKLSWPIPEFHNKDLPSSNWNTPHQLTLIYDTILDLQLPLFTHQEDTSTSWDVALSHIASYLLKVTESRTDAAVLQSRVKLLITKSKERFEAACWQRTRVSDCQPTYINIPWTELIMACIDYKLMPIHSVQDEMGSDLMVHSLLDRKPFYPPRSWLSATEETLKDQSVTGIPSLNDTIYHAVSTRSVAKRRSASPISTADSSNKTNDSLDFDPESAKISKKNSELDATIEQERGRRKNYEDFLQAALNEGASSDVDVDMFSGSVLQHDKQSSELFFSHDVSSITSFSDIENCCKDRTNLNALILPSFKSSLYDYNASISMEAAKNISAIVSPTLNRSSFVTTKVEKEKRKSVEALISPALTRSSIDSMKNKRKRQFCEHDATDSARATLKKSMSLSDSLNILNESIEKQKTADKLYELKLQSLVMDTFSDSIV